MDFVAKLKSHVARIEAGLDRHLPPIGTRPVRLHEAMRYSLQAGGKRLRPVLVLAAADLFCTEASSREPPKSKIPDPLPAAVAIECLHTYSLIHDDLPCMDNDDLRRGWPTAHKQFDEATALLAGDALLTHAFALLAEAYADRPALAHALIRELADAAGSRRLIGGQMEDLLAEKRTAPTADELELIHLNKTAAIIEAALGIGGIIGQANEDDLNSLRLAGRHLGLAFQIIDDVLDATADTATLGKTAGKDAKADKTTFVKLHGIEKSRQLAAQHTESMLGVLRTLPGEKAFLTTLVATMIQRRK